MPDELESLKDELAETCAQFELIGGKITEKQYARLIELKEKGTDMELQIAIDHFKREKAKKEKEK